MKDGLRQLRKQSLAEGGLDNPEQFYSTVSAVVNMSGSDVTQHVVVDMDAPSSVPGSSCNGKAKEIATQTDMTGLQVETIAKSRGPSSTNLVALGQSSPNLAGMVQGQSSPSLMSMGQSSPNLVGMSGSDADLTSAPAIVLPRNTPPKSSSSRETRQKRRKRRSKKAVVKKDSSSHLEVTSQGSGSSGEYPDEAPAMFELDMDEDELDFSANLSMGHSISMPVIAGKQQRVDEWANTQYASHFHPFSDGDITPVVR